MSTILIVKNKKTKKVAQIAKKKYDSVKNKEPFKSTYKLLGVLVRSRVTTVAPKPKAKPKAKPVAKKAAPKKKTAPKRKR